MHTKDCARRTLNAINDCSLETSHANCACQCHQEIVKTIRKQEIAAEQAMEYLLSKGVPNLDIERELPRHKVTLVELLVEYSETLLAVQRGDL